MQLREDRVRDFLITVPGLSGQSAMANIVSVAVNETMIKVIFGGQAHQSQSLETLRQHVDQALHKHFPGAQVMTAVTIDKETPKPKPQPANPPGIKHIIAVASGKGGVGKSTTAINLALGLSKLGQRVGILDADIYGPSIPMLMGLSRKPEVTTDKKLVPLTAHGLSCMSIGFLIPEDSPMIWRGPMVQGALMQLLKEVAWGELDVLVVDMPPGTGDAQLSLSQQAVLSGAIIVSTPQDVALIDAKKALNMFHRVGVPILGLIENMSFYQCPKCGDCQNIFGHGGVAITAEKLEIPFLGELPIDLKTREDSDNGTPIALDDTSPMTARYLDIALKVLAELSTRDKPFQPEIIIEE